jgi:hypothetical protein
LKRFPFGAVLRVQSLPEPLHSSEYVFAQLDRIFDGRGEPGFFDLLFSRRWVLPNHPPQMNALVEALRAEQKGGF